MKVGISTIIMFLYGLYVAHGETVIDEESSISLRGERDLQTMVSGYTMSSSDQQCSTTFKNTGTTTVGSTLTACANSCNSLSTCSGFSYMNTWLYGVKCTLFTVPIQGTTYSPGYNCYTKNTGSPTPKKPIDNVAKKINR